MLNDQPQVRASTEVLDERVRSLLALGPAVVYTCAASGDFGATFVSDNVRLQMGYEASEFTSEPSFWLSHVHPDDRERVLADLHHLFEAGTHVHEYRFLHRDDTYRWMRDECRLRRDEAGNPLEILGAWIDVSEHNESLAAQARLAAMLEATPDFVGIADSSGHAISLNRAGRMLTGVGADEDISHTTISDYHPDWAYRLMVEIGLPTAIRNGSWSGDSALLTRNGREIPVSQVLLSHKNRRGDVEFVSTICRDISERKRLEREIIEIASNEQERIGQDLHDGLGQALTGLGLLAKSLETELRATHSAAADDAGALVQGLYEAVGELRSIARGLLPIQMQDGLGLAHAISELVDAARERSGTSCLFECDGDVVIEDVDVANHLFRVAQEGVANALRHARAENVHVELAASGGHTILRITDDGRGMDEHASASLGYGMRIMRHRARLIGASLSIEGSPSGGTIVELRVADRSPR